MSERFRTDDRRRKTASDPSRLGLGFGATPGSGKTTVLVRRVIRLLLAGTPPARILCLTYTKAAAANMANEGASARSRDG